LGSCNVLNQDLLFIIPMLVILMLSQQSNSRLGVEIIGTRHVKII
jgi:hypothetical protein